MKPPARKRKPTNRPNTNVPERKKRGDPNAKKRRKNHDERSSEQHAVDDRPSTSGLQTRNINMPSQPTESELRHSTPHQEVVAAPDNNPNVLPGPTVPNILPVVGPVVQELTISNYSGHHVT